MQIWDMERKVFERDLFSKFGIQSVEKVSFHNKKKNSWFTRRC